MPFAHLHVYSEYSLLNSTCRIGELVERAKKEGQLSLALTDKNVLYGVIPFYNACKKAGIHPVIGMELSIAAGTGDDHLNRNGQDTGAIVLLAENHAGYVHLVKLASLVQCQKERCVEISSIAGYSEGLIALSGGRDGIIDLLLSKGKVQQAEMIAKQFRAMFPGRFYLECQRRGSVRGDQTEQAKRTLGRSLSLSLVATNSIQYLDAGDARAFSCLRCIDSGAKLEDDLINEKADSDFKSSAEMGRRFSDMPEAIEISGQIAEECHLDFSFGRMRLPAFPVPEGKTSEQVLREQCEHGLLQKYPVITEQVRQRLEKELAIIGQMGFNDYFLIVSDLIRHARESGYTPGPGRGSAAGSLVAYILAITEVDPLKYHLLFERFLNPERITMPDIDMDFPDVDRDKMIVYACEKYGKDHVAQIITFGTLAAKASIRDVGRVLNSDPRLVDRMAHLIPSLPKMTFEKALKESPKLQAMIRDSEDAAALFNLAKQIEGLPRHTSIHAAGVVFSDNPMTDTVPVQEGHDGIPVTQYPMEVLESLGLLKIDFLSLRNLTFLREVIRRVSVLSVKRLTAEMIPAEDPATFRMLGLGETTGVFQLESEGMRQVLRKLKPTDFEDVVAVIALYRPGPVQFIDRYIRRKHGDEPVIYPHPDLEEILAPTYGVIVYQEQIMQIAVKMAGYSLGQADILRRAVAKKKRNMLEDQKKDFLSGSQKNNYSLETASQIFDLIVRFANYGFNRSHAVAYGFVSYRLAYLKAHYPQAFMACHLSSISGNPDKMNAAVQEIRRSEIALLAPSVNQSFKTFEPSGRAIRFGLSAIKNLGGGAIDEILNQRETGGAYQGLYDFCRRVSLRKVNRKAIESMIFAGAMDEFGTDRAVLLATLDLAIRSGEEEQKNIAGQGTLRLTDSREEDYTQVPPLTSKEKLHYEREALGMYLSSHPLERFRKGMPPGFLTIGQAGRMDQSHQSRIVYLAVLVEESKIIRTKAGQSMAFLTLSDESGTADAVCFPACFEKNQNILQNDWLLVIEASISEKKRKEGLQLNVVRAETLQNYLQKKNAVLFFKIDRKHHRPEILVQLKTAIGNANGIHRVVLYYERDGKTMALAPQFSVSLNRDFIENMRRLLGTENVSIRSGRIFS
ncbi:DNA polymerase III subunit alpha [Sporolactobacillus pectinivorans]|uniref:DNA polymerase III subunit alpha n=1 Tax=Sporolactobacillus pectinivorans TaxID=1591408 RepID=UPI000C25BE99|nr:DNA polymerase III subunit alpha [Sporolactobacillus pectinivorans]